MTVGRKGVNVLLITWLVRGWYVNNSKDSNEKSQLFVVLEFHPFLEIQ